LSEPILRLVVLYDANANSYSVSAHNRTPDEAGALVQERNPHLEHGSSLITLEQPKVHKAADAQECEACRDIVRRSSGLVPLPKFVRRTS
jgi:hypothetical protein